MDRSRRCILGVLLATNALTVSGCSHCPQPVAPPPPICPVVAPPAPTVAPAPVPPPAPAAPPAPAPIVVKDAGLQTPECVLWDADQDVYLVSNINGDPTALDGNGFISKIGPDGKVIDLKWIDGSKKASELNAPKGMVITGGILYVADLNTIRKFDHKTGKPKGKIAVKDAVFLNGLAVSPDGKTLYVSDSAVKINQGQFSGTDGDAIYEVDLKKKSVKALLKDRTLHWPNGLWADDTGIWSVSMGRNELIHVNYKGEMGSVTKLPKGGLDGIVRLDDTSFLISSWEDSAIYRGVPGGEFTELITGVPSPAAIGLDSKRRALLIPVFMGNTVDVRTLPALPLLEAPSPPATPSKAAALGPAGPGSTPIPDPELAPARSAPAAAAPTPAAPAVTAPAPTPEPAAAPAAASPASAPAAAPPPAPSGPKTSRWK